MLNQLLANSLPYMPKKFVWVFSRRYVAGEKLEECIDISKKLNEKSIWVTVDLLGEFIHSREQAETNKTEYLKIIDGFEHAGIIGNFSLKPTSFGLLIDTELCYKLIREVVSKAASVRNFVRIDMEDARCTDREIDLFVRLKKEFPKSVGLVFQTYLRRTEDDILYLAKNHHSQESPLNIRICKGIYVESEQIAFKNADEIRIQYIKNLDFMLQNGIYAAIATHDKYLIDQAIKLISKHHVPRNLYEFQMLYGVTPNLRDSLVNAGHKMRLYVPFGQDWFGYCSRRIKENPKMASDILKALFVRG